MHTLKYIGEILFKILEDFRRFSNFWKVNTEYKMKILSVQCSIIWGKVRYEERFYFIWGDAQMFNNLYTKMWFLLHVKTDEIYSI
jgi:hypothetical protein